MTKLPEKGDSLSSKINSCFTSCNQIKQIFNSIYDSPKLPKDFKSFPNGTEKFPIKNKQVLSSLRHVLSGDWKKVFTFGSDGVTNYEIHYFQHSSGKVFDVKVKREGF